MTMGVCPYFCIQTKTRSRVSHMGLVCNQCPEETISLQACQRFHGVKWSWRGCLSGQQTSFMSPSKPHRASSSSSGWAVTSGVRRPEWGHAARQKDFACMKSTGPLSLACFCARPAYVSAFVSLVLGSLAPQHKAVWDLNCSDGGSSQTSMILTQTLVPSFIFQA